MNLISKEKFNRTFISRFGNSIANSTFTINEKEFLLGNNESKHQLHGVTRGFHKVIWKAKQTSESILELIHFSKHLDQGFPDILEVKVGSNLKKLLLILALFLAPLAITAQIDSLKSRLSFDADFRFRVEQDWDSRKSDGSFRDDRTRLRYRLRAGTTYKANWYEVGFRIRTGDPLKQQDPQLTLGDGFKEFGTLPIGIEKAYFQAKWNTFSFWVGKNTFPFEKSNELLWSDNVYPEGISLEKSFRIDSEIIDFFSLIGGHYIIATSNKSLNQDSYFQGFQISSSFFKKRLILFPSLYVFKNIPNIPDGNNTFLLDYSIAHMGAKIIVSDNMPLNIEFDYYRNLKDYSNKVLIPNNLKNQKNGYVIGLKYGNLSSKGDWLLSTSYAILQQYSVVDFLSQNDWARWDYSSSGSPDGRLTNFNGIELVAGHKIDKKINLNIKYYFVKQKIPFGIAKETGSRVRVDLDIKF
jgi:hypothetical protein